MGDGDAAGEDEGGLDGGRGEEATGLMDGDCAADEVTDPDGEIDGEAP
jgi:hypothetical protein